MSFGDSKYWIHKEDYFGALSSDEISKIHKKTLRELALAGTIGIVDFCSDDRRSELTEIRTIIAQRSFRLIDLGEENVA